MYGLQVDATAVVKAHFIENLAEYKGGAISADEESTSVSANEYAQLSTRQLPRNCFILFGNEQGPPDQKVSICNVLHTIYVHTLCINILYTYVVFYVSMLIVYSYNIHI